MKRACLLVISALIACVLFFFAPSKAPKNFSQAKLVAVAIHQNAVTFYCGCSITWQGQRGTPNLATCGYKPRKNFKRAQRIEWEHVVPAWQFGHQRICWQQGGRSGCAHDPVFNQIEADLHNLQPVIGEVNGDRKHFPFVELVGVHHSYGQCTLKVDFINRRVAPPTRARGAIARIYLYMGERYQLALSQQQLSQFKRWHQRYPVTAWECHRDQQIADHQGNHNPYVDSACKHQRLLLKSKHSLD